MSNDVINSTLEMSATESDFEGLSTKSLVASVDLQSRDDDVLEMELEDVKEPEEQPYLFLDIKGDREEMGSTESIISEDDATGRVDALVEMISEDVDDEITTEALAVHDQQLQPSPRPNNEDSSNASVISSRDEGELQRKLVDAESMLCDDVLNLELEDADVIRTTTVSTKALPFSKNPVLAVYWSPHCAKHYIPDHPEQPGRVKLILSTLRNHFQDTIVFREAKEATDEQVLRFHTPHVVDTFKKLATAAEEDFAKNQTMTYKSIDGDTKVMCHTRRAVFAAAGAAINAVDDVLAPRSDPLRVDTAFCCIRPPGHHAERNLSQGFCFFNNVAIAAMHAMAVHQIGRVAILDFDIHHGNGTEEGFLEDERVFYGSTHERDAYPGTGADPSPFVGENAKNPVHRRIVDRVIAPGPQSREDFHARWREILEEMVRFKPEFILISAGFDGHDDDELSNAELVEDDFEMVTSAILKAALSVDSMHPPKVVSLLEGGYDLNAISRSAVRHVSVLQRGYYGIVTDELLYRGLDIDKTFHGDALAAFNEFLKSSPSS